MTRRRTLATVCVLALLLVAGCTGGGGNGAQQGLANSGDGGATAAPEEAATSSGGGGGSDGQEAEFQAAAQANRKLIRTGEVTLRVDSFADTSRNLTRATRRSGGYVSDSSKNSDEYGNETVVRGTLVLRVPAGNFTDFMARIEAEGDVQSSTTNTKDVTEQVADVEARLSNLRAERDRLRELYEEANDTEAVLKVQERLSDVQMEIERLEARRKSLANKIAYSTITVHVNERPPERQPPEETHWYDTGALAAFSESIDGVVVVARAIFVGLAYALPYLLAFGIPVLLVVALLRRRGDVGGWLSDLSDR